MGCNVYQTLAGISHALFSLLMYCQQGALSCWLGFYSKMQIQNSASGDITCICDTLLKNISSSINQQISQAHIQIFFSSCVKGIFLLTLSQICILEYWIQISYKWGRFLYLISNRCQWYRMLDWWLGENSLPSPRDFPLARLGKTREPGLRKTDIEDRLQ